MWARSTVNAYPLLNDRKPKPISSSAVTPFCEAGRNHARQKLRESRIHCGPQHSYNILTCQLHERLHDALAGNHLNLTCALDLAAQVGPKPPRTRRSSTMLA